MTQKTGTIYGLGLGPGDPDLMSVKSHRLLTNAKHVASFRKAGREGQALRIVRDLMPDDATLFAMEYPVTTEIPLTDPRYNDMLAAFYADCTAHLRALAEAGEDVVVLCEGDPFFYGSFMHLYERLKDHVPVEVVPAITGMSGAWTATGQPITWGDDILTVLMGTLDEDTMAARMTDADAVVVMKIGRNAPKIADALRRAGKFDRAWIVEYATMGNQYMGRFADVLADPDHTIPYFAIVVVHGEGRRP